MALTHAGTRKFTVEEWGRLIDAGFFGPEERLELIEGEIVTLSPQNAPHARSISLLNTLLVRRWGDTHVVRVQLPLTLGDRSEPEPDFALVPLEEMQRADRHPVTADLVLEISDSSLAYDRGEKASVYAKAGLPEYWVVNTRAQRLEVRRDPGPQPEEAFGWGYGSLTLLAPGQTVTPLRLPGGSLEVAALLTP